MLKITGKTILDRLLNRSNSRPFEWFRQSWKRKILLTLFFFFVIMGTLNISFHIALGQFRQAEHEMDLATASMMQGQYDEALIHYSLAIDKNHRKRQAWIGKGLALMYLKRYEESLENYEDLIRMDPNNVEAWQGKGMSLGFMGKYDEAIASYDRALEIQPDYNLIQTQRERLQELQKQ